MEIIAHRGASLDAPENTLTAVRLAWEQAADGVEVDIRMTRDKKIVLVHDETGERTLGKSITISESSSTELAGLDAGVWKGAEWSGESAPTLLETFNSMPENKHLFVDIKSDESIVPELVRLVKDMEYPRDKLSFVGKHLPVMAAVKKQLKAYAVYLNVNHRHNEGHPSWSATVSRWIQKAGAARLDGLGLDCRATVCEETMRHLREYRMKLFAWTVDEPREAERLRELGVSYLCTNQPALIRR